jgi:hypothetical protein
MPKQRTSGNIRGGGLGSRVVKEVGVRNGTPARGISPGAVSQLGEAIGNHATQSGNRLPYKGESYLVGKNPAGGNQPLGNAVAAATKCGPGGSRQVMARGSQSTYGSPAGKPKPQGADILREFGPDTSNARNRR